MAENEETLETNWYKAAKILHYAKEGLQEFVSDVVDAFHKRVLQKLPPNVQCNTCTTKDVMKKNSTCPQNVCVAIKKEVEKVHRYSTPTFKNSNAQTWSNKSWELAKCFMPPGYSKSTTADNTDFSGLINVIECHTDFQALITERLNQSGNNFEKARKARNEIMHSPKMELSTNVMNSYFGLLEDVLSDKQHIQTLPKAQEAIKKLKKLQQDLITVTVIDKETIRKEYELLKKVTDDGIKLIKEKTTESIDNIKKKETKGIENLMIRANDSCKTLQKEKEIGAEYLKETVEESRGNLKRTVAELASEAEMELHEGTKRAKKSIEETKDVLVEYMKEEAKLQKQEIDSHTQSSIDSIEDEKNKGIKALQAERAKGPDQMVEDYDEKKKNLQKELIEHYSENGYCMSAIPALIDDEEVDVADMFDMPKMRMKQNSSKDSGSQRDEYITTIFEIFQKDRQRILKACISGEAGYGKTTFCQKILSNWCKLHTNQQTKSLQSDDQKFLKSFDFLFYVPLRNHTTPDIIDMIKAELVRRDMHEILDEVLRRDSRKCFIILDGLDEWLPPEDCGKRIPIFDPREKMTVLITSRPWKLEVLRPKNAEIGHEVELCGVTDRNKCVMAVVDYLNKKRGERKKWEDVFKEEQFRHVMDLLQVPTLLTQIVCMWYDDMDFGKTRVEVYCRMIDYYLQMANKRQNDTTKQNSYEFSGFESRKTENDCLLDIFRDLPLCKKYSDLLSKLSDLAFHTLFSEKKEASLVFPYSVTGIHKLNEVDLTFCLKAGLLSQAKVCSKVTLQTKKLSFIHKTVQEFLAAVFIVHNDNKFNEMLQTLSCLEDVFKMGEFLRFLSGLRPDLIYDMSKHIADLTDKDERVTSYRKSVNDDDDDDDYVLYNIESFIYDLVEEGCRCNKGEMVNKVIIRDLFFKYPDMGKDEIIYERIKGDEVKSFIIKHIYIRHFGKKYLKQLSLWLNKFHGANLCKVLFFIETQVNVDHLTDAIQSSLLSLTSLWVRGIVQHNRYLDYQRFLTTLMDTNSVTGISLNNIYLDHSGIQQLGQFLSFRTQLKDIRLRDIGCVTCVHTPCDYRIDLPNHRQLLKLDIDNLAGLVTLSEGLPLQYCGVHKIKCCPSVIACLKSSESLQELRVKVFTSTRENDDREASPSSSGLSMILTTVLPTLRNLKELTLSYVDFGQDLLRLSSNMKYMTFVFLDDCTQTLESFKCFIDSLPKTQDVLDVALSTKLTSPTNLDLSLIAANYLSQRYDISDRCSGPTPRITFSNHNHIITLFLLDREGNPEKPEIIERI